MTSASTRWPCRSFPAASGVVVMSSLSSLKPIDCSSPASMLRARVVLFVTKRTRWPRSRRARTASGAPGTALPETCRTPSMSSRIAVIAREFIQVLSRLAIPVEEIGFRYSRSSGPGGQHAQKTETRVEALFDVDRSEALTDAQKRRVVERAGAVLRAIAQD